MSKKATSIDNFCDDGFLLVRGPVAPDVDSERRRYCVGGNRANITRCLTPRRNGPARIHSPRALS